MHSTSFNELLYIHHNYFFSNPSKREVTSMLGTLQLEKLFWESCYLVIIFCHH